MTVPEINIKQITATKAHALSLYDTAVFYSNEITSLHCVNMNQKGMTIEHLARCKSQKEDFKYKASVLKDYCSDLKCTKASEPIVAVVMALCGRLMTQY